MSDLKLLQINDPHTSDRPPRYRTDAYLDEIFAKLEWSFAYAKQEKVDAILIPGDLFHIPQATKVSHSLVNRWMRLLDVAPCLVYAVAGNHDLAAGRIESIPKQPIGTLATHPNFILLDDGHILEIEADNHHFTIAGVSWNYNMTTEYIKVNLSGKVDILLLHAPIMRKTNPFFTVIPPEELEGLAWLIAYGHIHVPEPPYKSKWANSQCTFVNPGGLSRGSLTLSVEQYLASDSQRKPQVALIQYNHTGTAQVTYIDVPHKPMHDVFKVDTAEIKATGSKAIDHFVANLGKAEVKSISPEDLLTEAGKLTDEPGVKALLEEILLSV